MHTRLLPAPLSLSLAARRAFRLALSVALALAIAYGLALPFPYFAPLFAVLLGAPGAPPPAARGLLVLVLVVVATLGIGLGLTPMLQHYGFTFLLVIALGLYAATLIGLTGEKAVIGLLLTIGLTLVPAAGMASFALAQMMVLALAASITVAVVCQWLVYPLFQEEPSSAQAPAQADKPDRQQAHWIALRTTLIVLPPVLAAFTNPSLYLATIIKTTTLAQQGSRLSARAAGVELIGSTFLAGVFSIALWFGLKLWPSLWMFFLWILLFAGYIGGKLYAGNSRFPASFWQNVAVTVLILLGPAVEDSANGKDVYQGFAVRFALFVAVTLYAWLAIYLLEFLRARRLSTLSEGAGQ